MVDRNLSVETYNIGSSYVLELTTIEVFTVIQ
jgi:hypothetical protein